METRAQEKLRSQEQLVKLREIQKRGWTEIARYVREIDPYYHPVTILPTDCSHNQAKNNVSLVDFGMLQTGHHDRDSIPNHVNKVIELVNFRPQMPVLVGEVCYEGIGGAC